MPPAQTPATITITAVDTVGNVGKLPSIVIGTDGLPIIAYEDFANLNMKVAKCVNAACTGISTITSVDSAGDVGAYTSIAIGMDGLPIISYSDITNSDLKVAKCVNAACAGTSTLSVVDTASSSYYGSITIGTDGLPIISYVDTISGHLKVAKCVNAACTGASMITTVDSAIAFAEYTSMTIGADGLPVISYYDAVSKDLKVAKCVNASCLQFWKRR